MRWHLEDELSRDGKPAASWGSDARPISRITASPLIRYRRSRMHPLHKMGGLILGKPHSQTLRWQCWRHEQQKIENVHRSPSFFFLLLATFASFCSKNWYEQKVAKDAKN